jgi:hypothetical protein
VEWPIFRLDLPARSRITNSAWPSSWRDMSIPNSWPQGLRRPSHQRYPPNHTQLLWLCSRRRESSTTNANVVVACDSSTAANLCNFQFTSTISYHQPPVEDIRLRHVPFNRIPHRKLWTSQATGRFTSCYIFQPRVLKHYSTGQTTRSYDNTT